MQHCFNPTRWNMEDDLIFFKMEDDLIFLKMEDDLGFFLNRRLSQFLDNGRRPQFFINGRQPQFCSSWFLVCNIISTQLDEIWKTTSIFLKIKYDLIFFWKSKTTSIFDTGRRPKFFEDGRRPHFYLNGRQPKKMQF